MRPALKVLVLTLPILVFAVFGLILLRGVLADAPVPYGEFQRLLAAGRVERVVVRGDQAEVILKPPLADQVAVRLPGAQATPDASLISQLEAQGVDYRFEAPGQWLGTLLNFLPALLFFAFPAALLAALLVLLLRRPRPSRP